VRFEVSEHGYLTKGYIWWLHVMYNSIEARSFFARIYEG